MNRKKPFLPELSTSGLSSLIDEWVRDERDRKILKRCMIDNITYERAAEEFDMSVQNVKRVTYKSQQEILKHL